MVKYTSGRPFKTVALILDLSDLSLHHRANTRRHFVCFIKIFTKISLHNMDCNYCTTWLADLSASAHLFQTLCAKKAPKIFKAKVVHIKCWWNWPVGSSTNLATYFFLLKKHIPMLFQSWGDSASSPLAALLYFACQMELEQIEIIVICYFKHAWPD